MPQAVTTAAIAQGLAPPSSLTLIRIPHWGWRARAGAHNYEIERVTVGHGERSTRFRATVRLTGRNVPVTARTFGTLTSARTWLGEQHAVINGGA